MSRIVYRLQVVVVSILFFLFTVTCTLTTVYAAEDPSTSFGDAQDKSSGQEFATSYDVVYDVGSDGITTVTEKITLKNLTSQYYAEQFKLTIGATQISDVKAADSGGSMEVATEQKDTSTEIVVKFNQQITGLGKTLPWTLQFKSRDFAEKVGKIWEVRAPKISSTQSLENYNLTISVPFEFGEPTLISPIPKSQTVSSGRLFLTFGKDQLQQSGVSASFGINQLFDFDLSYHLENNNLVPILTNIALPPDTSYQDVIYQRIEPKPVNVTVDDDGNYLAWYRLKNGEKLDVKVFGSAKLYSASKVKNPVMDDNLKRKYTAKDKYWEKDHPQIVDTLTAILGSDSTKDTSEKARLIYRYVVDSLKYDQLRLKDDMERYGAVAALNNPNSAVCMEFTDLFIALLRAAGIPARELDGFAYTQNPKLRPLSLAKDVLHAWPEYWDEQKGWIVVDPTWENTTGGVDYFTKFDLNHFVFSIKGSSSTQPLPAGSYKYKGVDTKDVKVTLSEVDFLGKPQLDIKVETANPIVAGFAGKIKISVANLGNALYPPTSFSVTFDKITILGLASQSLGPVPAFGTAEFDFNIRTKSIFDSYNDQITIVVGGQKFVKNVRVEPFILFKTIPLIMGGIILGIGGIYFAVLGGLIIRRRYLKIPQKWRK